MNPPRMTSRRPLLWLTAGFLVWSGAFVAIYAVMSFGCELGWDSVLVGNALSLQRLAMAAVVLLGCAACAVVAVMAWRRDGRASDRNGLLAGGAFLSALAALGATVVTMSPALFLTACL